MSQGPTVEERIVRLVRAGERLFEWRCTPAQIEALVIGRLYAEGLIQDARVERDLRISEQSSETVVVLDAPLHAKREARTRATGLPTPESEAFAELFRTMFSTIDARHPDGGMHGAALVRDDRVVVQAEDVGRHNAVDKVIGLALREGLDLKAHGMIVTSRVSGEIARKASDSGVAWLASRSIPTTLAVSLARAGAMPIIGRAASKNATVYQ